MYQIAITRPAQKDLRRLPVDEAIRIDKAIIGLAQNPRPPGSMKLKCPEPLYRTRVGNYRVIYAIDDAARIVTIARVRHRKDVYDDL